MDQVKILLLALIIDAIIGDPPILYHRIAHPIVLLGHLITWGERCLNRGRPWLRLINGVCLTLALIVLTAGSAYLLSSVLNFIPGGWLLEALLASILLAWRSLYDHVKAVATGLQDTLAAGRAAVAHIVGRDPDSLDQAGVARAAIESSAENFSDGVVAPVFWLAILGLPGIVVYKTINTLDSMIAHHSPRYEMFGKFAARLDDVVNFIPARLAGLLFVAAAYLLPGADGLRAWKTMWRDATKHRSPNAGWQESAVAGALDFALAGPRVYAAKTVKDHWMGNGRSELDSTDIFAALRLYCAAGGILLILVLVLHLLFIV